MGSFIAKHQYLVIWVSSLAIIGALATLIVDLNGASLPTISALNQPTPTVGLQAPAIPTVPSVTFSIQKTTKGSNLVIQWQNLPGYTTALNIFRAKKNSDVWQLWKTIQLNATELFNGSAIFNLGLNGNDYSYYVQATSGGNPGVNSTSTNILWTSSSTDPIVTTSTNSGGGGGDQNNNGGNGNGNENGNGNSSSSQGNNGNGNGNNGSGGNSSGTGSGSGVGGNAYYNPQIQVTGYGADKGDFWVQHINQSIEIGWQNLPVNTDGIVVVRSPDQDGPWSQILKEQNPGISGSYSLQLVDGTIGDPYYYEMSAYQGTNLLETYGPAYLAPSAQ